MKNFKPALIALLCLVLAVACVAPGVIPPGDVGLDLVVPEVALPPPREAVPLAPEAVAPGDVYAPLEVVAPVPAPEVAAPPAIEADAPVPEVAAPLPPEAVVPLPPPAEAERARGDVFTFRADRMSGTQVLGREVIILAGNAEIQADNMILRANRIEISGDNNQFIDSIGDVWGMEIERNIIFSADRIRYDRDRGVARLEGNAVLEDRENEVVAMGGFIEFDEETEITVMQISVRLFQDDMVSRAQHAVYRRIEQILDLSGFPVVFRGDDEFRADRIRVDLDTNDVIMEGSVTGTIRN